MFRLANLNLELILLYLLFTALALKFYQKIYFISSTVIIIGCLALIIILSSKLLTLNKRNNSIYLLFTLMIFIQLFSYFWTNSTSYSLSKISYFSMWIITFILYTNIINKYSENILKINFSIGIVYIILIFLEYGSPFQIISSLDKFSRLGHSDDNSTNPIVIARYLGFFCITLFFLFYKKNIIFKGIISFLILICLIFIFLTGSKGIILSLILVIILFMFKIGYKYLTFFSGFIIIILSLLIIFIDIESLLKGSKLYQFIEYRFLNTQHNSYSTRENQFSYAINSFIDGTLFQQLFGYGIGNFGIAYLGLDDRYYPHNIFLEILYENGIFGLSIFLYIVLFMFKSLYTFKLNDRYLFYIIVCYYYFLFNAMVSGDIYENIPVFIFFLLYNDFIKRKN